MMNINGDKAALVTGASHGIGLELAKILLSDGWVVYGTGRDVSSLEDTKALFPRFVPIQSDFTRNSDIELVARVIKDSGIPLHLSVQNAGMKSPPRPLTQYDCDSIDEVFQVNLLAPMKLTALLASQMPVASRILFVTSRAATLKLKESSTYCASKAGLDEVTAIARKELAENNIGVSCVIPGEVDTQIQKTLRETTSFYLHKMFDEAYQTGQLISPKTCAEFLKWFLCDLSFDEFRQSNMPVSIYEEWHHPFWLKDKSQLPPFPF
ncbi:TPA: SDR family NAD(P)-dependent oxidoreductase [Legionella pneumophila]|nr:SDR family oxidoreductase [Legionella pneumophila]RYW28600.1 SDR family oxidoreductase [Legionella pneumophila]HAT8585521.1 SDR family NAD(P)-dependent oxidoreductase [Legionella pneumophila]HAU1564395.1 SDR family oxidoreductase [Legionella pneumophila]HAU1854959.1 SDR family oxidoreductase [Legionella pneumophila]